MGSRLGRCTVGWVLLANLVGVAALADATQPSTAPADESVEVKRGDLELRVEADGWFEPVEPFRVRFRPEAYKGELRVESAAAHGSAVKKGDVLLSLDSAEAKRQLAAAENELVAARANLAKAQADVKLGEQADALAARVQSAAEADAVKAVDWWEKLDGPQYLLQLERQVKFTRNSVEDQEDELDQLRKMYKSEDLTNATADIVVKRAVRQLELSRESLDMTQKRVEKNKAFEYEQNRRNVLTALDQQKQAGEALRATQAQQKVIRETVLATAQAATDAAQRKVEELSRDVASFTVIAPFDGMVFWGDLNGGNWANNSPDALTPGTKLQPEQRVLTLAVPGATRVVVSVPETRVARVAVGQAVRVTPRALPELQMTGKVASVSSAATQAGDPPRYDVVVQVEKPDPRLLPGFRSACSIDIDDATGVLLIPVSAVSNGKVKLKKGDATETREVVTGRSDGESVEVVSGLSQGDRVLSRFKKD